MENEKSSKKPPGAVMPTNANSTPETAGSGSAEASAPASRHRVRGWRPRTTRAKAGLAAVAAVGAAALGLALAVGPAGAATKPAWGMTASNIQTLSGVDASTASYFFNTSTAYGNGASLVKTPVQAKYATTPVLTYTSYAQFQSDLTSGAITYPYKWVMYDPEDWAATPVNEQQDPVKYMTLFGQLAHANGLKVIQAPALDLGSVTGSVLPRLSGESVNAWDLRVNIAGAAAAAGDIYLLQDESNTTGTGGVYASMFNTAEGQAQTANASVKVFSEVSAVNGTAAQMASAAQSISPDGYYVAAAGNIPQTDQFLQLMKTAGY
jgi:hypothetical protein